MRVMLRQTTRSSGVARELVGRRSVVLALIASATFMAFLDTTIVNIAFPAISRDFPDASRSALSWIINAYNITFAALLVPSGRLADRYGRRPAFIAGLLLFTVASGACGLAPSVPALIAFRVVQAAGAAILIPTGLALLLEAYPTGKQVTAIALLGAVSGAAMAAGPTAGGALVDSSGWAAVFLINVPIGLVAAAIAAAFLSRAHTRDDGQLPDIAGIVLFAGAVLALAIAIVEGGAWGWLSPRIVASFALSVVLLAAFAQSSRSHTSPVVDFSLFRQRTLAVANACTMIFSIGLAAKLLCDVLFMVTVWHFSILQAGLGVSPSPLITAVTARSAGRIADRYGYRAAAVPGGLLYGIGCLWLLTATGAHPSYVSEFLPGTIFTGIGIALIMPSLAAAAVAPVPPSRFAVAAGVNSMARQLGAVIGVAAFIAIVGNPTPATAVSAFHNGYLLAALTSLTAGGLALAFGARKASVFSPAMVPNEARANVAGSQ